MQNLKPSRPIFQYAKTYTVTPTNSFAYNLSDLKELGAVSLVLVLVPQDVLTVEFWDSKSNQKVSSETFSTKAYLKFVSSQTNLRVVIKGQGLVTLYMHQVTFV